MGFYRDARFIMKLILMSLSLLFAGFAVQADTRFYQSNESAMQLGAIRQADKIKYSYYLEVVTDRPEETRIFFENGIEIKRFEIIYYDNGNIKSEKNISEGKTDSVTLYDRSRRIGEEQIYTDGELAYTIRYEYPQNPRKYTSITAGKDDAELYAEEYSLGDAGELRQIRKIWPDGQFRITSFVYSSRRIFKELQSSNEEMTIEHYDSSGNLAFIEVWRDQTLVRKSANTYDAASGFIASSERDFKDSNTLVRETYDTNGRITNTVTERDKRIIEEIAYSYSDSGKRTRTERKSDIGLEEWIFSYDKEDELAVEDYRVKGQLEKRTSYVDGSVSEERIYDAGVLIVIAYYEKQKKVKEEFFEKGKLIRTRETGKKP